MTAPDIIFFWVARMIMAGYEFMGAMPFRNVYFTGIVRDKLGRKMSKTLGNSPDPLQLIANYSADALRFGTMRSAPLGQDVLFDEKDVELGRNFCNKLWNACRFRQMQGGDRGEIAPRLLTSDDKWILLRLDTAIRDITTALKSINSTKLPNLSIVSSGANSVIGIWRRQGGGRAARFQPESEHAGRDRFRALEHAAALSSLHPLYHRRTLARVGLNRDFPRDKGASPSCSLAGPNPLSAPFASTTAWTKLDERFVNAKYELVTQARNLRRESNVPSGKKVKFVFVPANPPVPPTKLRCSRCSSRPRLSRSCLITRARRARPWCIRLWAICFCHWRV